ncbi:hypothetical protein EI77_00957 [Prosthecobacter fusiformis]|uniref:Uncharacterized protein n=1 Tax=Prosthecobacter fusiformis TaxID=48464 RepID=A0A4R7STM5_9BACT|nr:hypothetical protein [Prosthecobacter fusiformis]TDU81647.1 hypothetical protein EI77_00957 [Prosthecobacter fusiformis]
MTRKLSSGRKRERVIAGFFIVATALLGAWVNGMFGNVPPFPADYRQYVIKGRISQANFLQEQSIPKGRLPCLIIAPWHPQPLNSASSPAIWEKGKVSLRVLPGGQSLQSGHQTVVLINDTNLDFEVPGHLGEVGLKLEVKLADSTWHRAQALHNDRYCGIGDMTHLLPARSYVELWGYRPISGRVGKIRYAIYNDASDRLVSAELEGVYSSDDLAMAEYDELAMHEATLSKLRDFLLRKTSPALLPDGLPITFLRHSAWNALLSGNHDRAAALAVASRVLRSDPTLESRQESLEVLMGQWRAAMNQEALRQPRIHGFFITKKTARNSTMPFPYRVDSLSSPALAASPSQNSSGRGSLKSSAIHHWPAPSREMRGRWGPGSAWASKLDRSRSIKSFCSSSESFAAATASSETVFMRAA